MDRRAGLAAAAIALAAALAAAALGRAGAGLVEAAARARAEAALASIGAGGWAEVEADGLRLALIGEAPDEAARAAARAALAAIRPPLPGLTIAPEDRATTRPPAAAFRPPARIVLLRGADGLSILGAAPSAEVRAALAEAVAAEAPGAPFRDFSRADGAVAAGAPDWTPALRPAAAMAAALLHGAVEIDPEGISVAGLAAGPEEVARIEAGIETAERLGFAVEADLASPPPPRQVFRLQVETGRGGRGLLACAAPDESAAQALAARLAAPGPGRSGGCVAAEGAPAGWMEAVGAALDALDSLPAAELSLVGLRVRLAGRPPTRRRALEAAASGLRAALPPGYGLAVLSGGATEEEAGAADAPDAAAPAGALRLEFDGARLAFVGAAPDPLIADALAAYARTLKPGVKVDADLVFGGAFDPHWRAAAMSAVAALTRLERGRAAVDEARARLAGDLANPLAAAAIHRALAQGVGPDRAVSTRLRVSPSRLAAAEPLPPGRCAGALSEAMAAAPIDFPPGGAEIGEAEGATVARLAAILARCPGARIEVGGHTDSQGRESTNLALSRARAEAVVAALVGAGARLSQLVATGYGEAEPIADNAAEEGRTRNRRIAFRALTEARE